MVPLSTRFSIDVTIPKAIRSSTTKGTAGHSTEANHVYARPYRERFTGKLAVTMVKRKHSVGGWEG